MDIVFYTERKVFTRKRKFTSHYFVNMRHSWFWKLKQRLKQTFSAGTLLLAFFLSYLFLEQPDYSREGMENPTAKQFMYCSQENLKSKAKISILAFVFTMSGHKIVLLLIIYVFFEH